MMLFPWMVKGMILTKCPYCLFAYIPIWRRKKRNKVWHRPSIYHCLRLFWSSWSNVRKSPGGLELKKGVFISLQELHHSWNNPSLYECINRGISFPRKNFSGSLGQIADLSQICRGVISEGDVWYFLFVWHRIIQKIPVYRYIDCQAGLRRHHDEFLLEMAVALGHFCLAMERLVHRSYHPSTRFDA